MVFLVLLVLLLTGLVTAVALAGRGLGSLGRAGLRNSGGDVRLRALAALLGAGAVALYTWGLLHVIGAVMDAEDGGTNSAPILPCRTTDPWEQKAMAVDYDVDYVPLRFICETADGGGYTAGSVPGYVNPAVLVLALTAVVCAGAAALESERRAVYDPAAGPGADPAP